MFDRIFFNDGPSHVSVDVKVKEQRAPTDESVKLLQEMQQKTLDSILQGIRLNNNEVNCALVLYQDNFGLDYIVRVRMTVNGREHMFDLKFPIDDLNFRHVNVVEKIATEVAKRLIQEPIYHAIMSLPSFILKGRL